ncbi:ATP-dependent DNA helicase MER3 [Smittium culicis]|uniref:ATP-dependent DNA helicase MER3 n=1 Tax=Smittium culicis TaxID=133412 RepID=A0A1R1WYL4_9FUNG|nr:ATP-dependent DNA helicase MER3 [Smittium culicis]OMJ25290.1 ATP-dependent DNA helicase MER3 [Smittium culicis]
MFDVLGYNNSGFSEYSKLDVVQMIGRAGRPQFDDFGVAILMTSNRQKETYENTLKTGEIIESTYVLNKKIKFEIATLDFI